MKKVLSLVLALAMVFSLAACGSKDDGKTTTAAQNDGTTAAAPAETAAGGETEAGKEAGAEIEGAKEGVMPAIAKEDLKIGVIHITDPAEGSGYTYTHDQGIVGMQKNLGLSDDQIVRKNNVNDSDATAIETAIQECLEEGCNVIFATSWGFMDTCEALAEEYPEVIFSHGTGYKSNGKNFNNYFGRIYQARYLSGIAAGLKTESNKIGYVAAMGKDNSEVTGGCDAFAMGVYSVNPDAEIYVRVTNSWFDPEGETQAANALLDLGCDVIGQHCDTPNPQLAAEAAGVWGVGYNSDMSKDAPKAALTSVVWDWSVYYTYAVESIMNGTWTGENYFAGLKEGLVDISPLADFCAEGTEEKINEAREKLLSGEWDVFSGLIETNEGEVVCEEGQTLDDATITGGINWYFKNIVAE